MASTRTAGGRARRWNFRRITRVGSCVLIAAGLAWCMHAAPRLFTDSSAFALQALEVNGLRVLKGSEILAASGLQVGDNVFAADLDSMRGHIESLPWVRSATVCRRPPHRLSVHISERRRLAWVDLGVIYGVDAEGIVLPGRRDGGESLQDLDLPVISGLDCHTDSLMPGMVVPDSTLRALLEWWQHASRADTEFGLNVSEIQPLGVDGVRLRLVGDGLEVRLPRDRVSHRIRTLKELMKRVYRECPAPAYIDMRFAGQVVVGSKERCL
jgi:cell division protein FtsQ